MTELGYMIFWGGVTIACMGFIIALGKSICTAIKEGFDKLENAIWMTHGASPLKPDTQPNHLEDCLTEWELIRERDND